MMDWLNDPALNALDPVKKELFRMVASKVSGKNGNAMVTTMMSLITSAKQRGIQFTSEEISLILQIMKKGKTASEKQQIDHTVQMIVNMMQKQNK